MLSVVLDGFEMARTSVWVVDSLIMCSCTPSGCVGAFPDGFVVLVSQQQRPTLDSNITIPRESGTATHHGHA